MSSLKLLTLGLLAALIASCSLVEAATNATSHDGNSPFLQMLFDKYGKDGVISYSGFELLLKKVGIVVVSPPGDDQKLSDLEHAQAHSQHPAHGHHSDAGEKHVIDNHSTGLHEHAHSEWNETHTAGEAGASGEKERGSKEKGGRDHENGADVADSVQGSQGQKSRRTRSVGEDDHTKHYLHAGQLEKQVSYCKISHLNNLVDAFKINTYCSCLSNTRWDST
ncbi:hypothetical protein NP493_3820g00000 [Ridgeia piscesae]|uniref:Uncharacterized protein n=1 Tax=Ridgeia piscesae TaxID=27915 RepID=A0AAD9J5D1_RIDPI|nr:hypothetical protein NP493_3820g00001 [Ridgeia piscesae]KAK2145925.1 hypothetical protein NP493_3820g00000 [Ridgeia piscesae]